MRPVGRSGRQSWGVAGLTVGFGAMVVGGAVRAAAQAGGFSNKLD